MRNDYGVHQCIGSLAEDSATSISIFLLLTAQIMFEGCGTTQPDTTCWSFFSYVHKFKPSFLEITFTCIVFTVTLLWQID